MQILIRLPGDSSGQQLSELRNWLLLEPQLRGRVTIIPKPADADRLGGAWDALAVALGSGGTGAALSGALSSWLSRRRQDTKIEIDRKNKKYTFTNVNSEVAREILKELESDK